MPLQRPTSKQPHIGHDDIRDQRGVTLDRYSEVAVLQIFFFNAPLARNNPASPLSPCAISVFLCAIKFTRRNVVEATLCVQDFMAHEREGGVNLLFSFLDLMGVIWDQVLVVDMERQLGTETICDYDGV